MERGGEAEIEPHRERVSPRDRGRQRRAGAYLRDIEGGRERGATAIAARLAMCDEFRYPAHIDVWEKTAIPKSGSARRSAPSVARIGASVLEEARRAGLLDGEKTEHVSFRAPPALVAAAKREAGITSTTELGMVALAMLARPDPVVEFLRRTEGRLGRDHDLDTGAP